MTAKNLVQIFENSCERHPDKVCFRFVEHGEWKSLDWKSVREKVQSIAGSLKSFGVRPQDKVCVFARTRYEWTIADLAILSCRAVTVPIYESNTPEQAQFIIEDSEAKVVFVENALQFKKIEKVWDKLPGLKHVILIESQDRLLQEGRVHSFREELLQHTEEGARAYQDAIEKAEPKDVMSIVYTSGTTGNPKGAMMMHDNFLAEVEGANKIFEFPADYTGFLFLPLAHIFGRATQYFQLNNGFVHAYVESLEKLTDNIAHAKPHFMMSVPRVFEKIHAKTLQNVESSSALKKKIFHWSMRVGTVYAEHRLQKKPLPFWAKLKYKIAYLLVFKKLHQKLGGNVVFFISGGAPLSAEIARFFLAFGVPIFEGYGLTETTAAIAVNDFEGMKPGTVGKPVPDCEFKIADDGEILVRGRYIFKGYYRNEAATREAIDPEGWFHTGDIGEIDEDGFVKITDRKKEIIVTAGGKKIPPQNVENLIKTNPYISQVVVHGDKRKFLSALVTLDQAEIEKYAKTNKIAFENYSELVKTDQIHDFVKKIIDEKNRTLARFETVKKFVILDQDFSIETGELTPTLKIKRKFVNQKYKDHLDRLYTE